MPETQRGEVWLVDLGLAAKVRPCLVLSVPVAEQDRALIMVVAHTPQVHVGHALKWRVRRAFCALGCLMRKTWSRSHAQSCSENEAYFPQHNLPQWKRRYGYGLVCNPPPVLSLEVP
jgi:mRNA interferase MazF